MENPHPEKSRLVEQLTAFKALLPKLRKCAGNSTNSAGPHATWLNNAIELLKHTESEGYSGQLESDLRDFFCIVGAVIDELDLLRAENLQLRALLGESGGQRSRLFWQPSDKTPA